jgi:uncharacterized Zn-binding protein involved in type VI secretion
MPPAARVGDMHTCPMVNPGPVPHVGGPVLPAGCPTVLIGGQPAARVGDMAVCTGPPDSIAMGSPTVLIGNKMAARLGDFTVHGGVIVAGCPTVHIGIPGQGSTLQIAAMIGAPFCEECARAAQARAAPTPVTDLIKSTPKYDRLPETIALSKDACDTMDKLWGKSIDASGNSQEYAGTLAVDPSGTLVVLNEKGGSSGDSDPETTVPSGHRYVGTFHTHPYGKNDGSWDGVHLPFSDDDFGSLDEYKESISAVQSGDIKYVLVKTDKTPATISTTKANKAYHKVFDAEYAKQQAAGKTEAEAASLAGEVATKALAKKYHLGYFKGDDCQSLSRVNP